MFASFLDFYVRVFTTLLPMLTAAAVAVAAQQARATWRETAFAVGCLGLLFGLWYALAAFMGLQGLLMPPETVTGVPYILFFLFGGSALLILLGQATKLGRKLTGQADQRVLVAFQVPRVMGGVFLLGWAFGEIPWQFALPAGLGDIWAGIAGWQAYQALNRGADNARALVWRANVIGLADFVVAVGTGLMTSEGFLHVMAKEDPNIINHFPLVLFPAFFVPIFLSAHVFSILRLRRSHAELSVSA